MSWRRYLTGYRMVALSIMGLLCLGVMWQVSSAQRKHDFTGKCQYCHTQTPPAGAGFSRAFLREDAADACVMCHSVDPKSSHPVGMPLKTGMSLAEYLDSRGRLTCLTCHDVHQERKAGVNGQDVRFFLRGHTSGRAFCSSCHQDQSAAGSWKHAGAISYAHMNGRLIQEKALGMLDLFSVECLSCHDGVIAKMASGADVRAGNFQHSTIGLSHPVGVAYPRPSLKNDFVDAAGLPPEIRLFDGKVGCLSCHDPYIGKKNFLVKGNKGSALCLACHRK